MTLSAAIGVLALAIAQPSPQSFGGTWEAARDGKVYARLELREANGTLSGRISLGAMHVDKDGVVDAVQEPATNFTPIFDVVMRDGVVAFARKDGFDTDRFELRIAGAGLELAFFPTAEDREAFAREGVPPPKPVRLVKTP